MTTEPALTHARAFELLPWLVNGSLTGAERDAVESHVRACIACRRELKQQQRLHGAVRARRTGRRLRRGWVRPTRPRARRNGTLEPTLARPLRFGCAVRHRGRRRSGRARRPALVHPVAAARQQQLLDARDGAGKRRRAARHRVCRGDHGRRDARAARRHRRRDRGGPEPAGPLQRAPRRGSCD